MMARLFPGTTRLFQVVALVLLLSSCSQCQMLNSTNSLNPDPKYVFMLRGDTAPLVSTVPERSLSALVRTEIESGNDNIWEEDVNFGTIFRCSEETKSFLEIPGISLGDSDSGFALSFWFKTEDGNTTAAKNQTAYLLSTAGSQISVALGESESDIPGLLRSTVAGDASAKASSVYSNDCVDAASCPREMKPPTIADGNWHHMTITTNFNGTAKGYRMYIDGVKVGETETGGGIDLRDGSMFLCAADGTGTDIFDGNIVDLVMYDESLTEDQVVVLYNARNPFTSAISPGMCSDIPIPGLFTQTTCEQGYQCYILPLNDIVELTNTHEYDDLVGRIGLCVPSWMGQLLPDPYVVPTADVFYPLVSNRIQSYPMSLYSGTVRGVSVVPDTLFGQTLYCNGSDKEYISLDPVAYGVGGGFTINFWVRPDAFSTEGYSWLFSHTGSDNDGEAFGPNQVQIYLTENDSLDYGHVSALVRDNNDDYSGMDSTAVLNGDGTIGTMIRKSPDSADDPDDIYDGDWHMITLSSHPNRQDGYILYVDGNKVNELSPSTNVSNILGEAFEIGGGNPMLMTGNIVLCSRGYGDPYPFHGQVAWLSIWNQPLIEGQIRLLYEAVAQYGVQGSAVSPSNQDDVWSDPSLVEIVVYSTSGKQCKFPTLYQHKVTYGCVLIDGISQCQVQDGDSGLVWEPCDEGMEPADQIDQRSSPGEQLDSCLLSESPKDAIKNGPQGCKEGLLCVPTGGSTADVGICDVAPTKISQYHVFNWINEKDIPQPTVLYPLLDESMVALTYPQYLAKGTNIGWGWDDSFRAAVPRCSSSLSSQISLNTDASTSTMRTSCMWFAADAPVVATPSQAEQVLWSTRAMLSNSDPIEVQITMQPSPEKKSQYSIHIEMTSSNGKVLISAPTSATINADGTWNFVCFQSKPGTNDGNSTTISASLNGNSILESQLQRRVEFDSTGDIKLCSSTNRIQMPGFDGNVAQYMEFDEYLSNDHIKSLFAIFGESGIVVSPDDQSSSDGGLSGGAIAGIVIASIIAAIGLAILLILLVKKIARSRPNSFKKYEDSVTPSNQISSREFSYEYNTTENSTQDGYKVTNNPTAFDNHLDSAAPVTPPPPQGPSIHSV